MIHRMLSLSIVVVALGSLVAFAAAATKKEETKSHEGTVVSAGSGKLGSGLSAPTSSVRTISGRPTRGGPWTGPYIKVCSSDELQIAAWTGSEVGAAPKRCGLCMLQSVTPGERGR